MILVDTGPLVALFDLSDAAHHECVGVLETIHQPIATTVCVLTEVFHLLSPPTSGSRNLMSLVAGGGLQVLEIDGRDLARAFELMMQNADAPMDLADASLLTMAEKLDLRTIFTIDRNDFYFYRIRVGRSHTEFEVIDGPLSSRDASFRAGRQPHRLPARSLPPSPVRLSRRNWCRRKFVQKVALRGVGSGDS